MITVVDIIAAAVLAALGFAAGLPCCGILNRIPAPWLCDYDEEPSQELLSGKRYTFKKHGIPLGAAMAAAAALTTLSCGFSVSCVLVMLMYFTLALIAGADAKYYIIPDQFTAAAAVIAVIHATVDMLTNKDFVSKWYECVIGAIVGAGILVILDLFSVLVLKKEGFGFGDIKLLAALGLMFGWKYIIVLLVAASFIAAIHFLVLIFMGKGIDKEGSYLPMGPYLCIAAAVTVITQPWFEPLFNMYKTLLEMDTLP